VKTALALFGGGGKGAFQVGVEEVLRERYGMRWDGIFGVSVGALNGAVLAARREALLKEIWLSLSNRDVYRGRVSPWSALLFALGIRRSLTSNLPIRRRVEDLLPALEFTVPLRAVWMDLVSGQARLTAPGEPHFKDALIASAGIPVVWEPVEMPQQDGQGVDGGLADVSPVGVAASQFDADRVVLVTCRPARLPRHDDFRHGVNVIRRSLDILLQELADRDLEGAERINRLLAQARGPLRSARGRPYKPVELIVVDPTDPLGDTLDFTAGSNAIRYRHGRQRAIELMEARSARPLEAPAGFAAAL
jgi:NTE family protein